MKMAGIQIGRCVAIVLCAALLGRVAQGDPDSNGPSSAPTTVPLRAQLSHTQGELTQRMLSDEGPSGFWLNELNGLPSGSSLTIEMESTGCFHHWKQKFRFLSEERSGRSSFVAEVSDQEWIGQPTTHPFDSGLAGRFPLTEADQTRLDNFLSIFRLPAESRGTSSTSNHYRISLQTGDVTVREANYETGDLEDDDLAVMGPFELRERLKTHLETGTTPATTQP